MTLVEGDGFAARACVKLLREAGGEVGQRAGDSHALPVVLVPWSSAALIQDVLQVDVLSLGAHASAGKEVRWGAQQSISVPHKAFAISGHALTSSLPAAADLAGQVDWRIRCQGPVARAISFGSRSASYVRARLAPCTQTDCCLVEALADGWLFLIPGAGDSWVIAVGGEPEGLLNQSILLRPRLAEWAQPLPPVPAHPLITWPIAEHTTVLAGSAAVRFDPLCGDGTGHAVREAILATATARAAIRGEDAAELARHYSHRILGGFRRHLQACLAFYETGGGGAWWRAQAAGLHEGLAFCDERLRGARFQYRLNGLELERLS